MTEQPEGILNTSTKPTKPLSPIEDIRRAVEMIQKQNMDYCGSETTPHVVHPRQPDLCISCFQVRPGAKP